MLLTADFASEIWSSLRFFFDYARGKPNTHTLRNPALPDSSTRTRPTFGDAFGLYKGGNDIRRVASSESESHLPVIQDVEAAGYGGSRVEAIAHHGYDKSLGEAIPMHAVDGHLNAEDLAYSVPPRQVQNDKSHT